MSTHDALLHVIRANPADDLPRLVYADFLDEIGDPDRAAFIRLQIETAKLPPFTPERDAAEKQEQALLADNRERWVGPLAAPVGWMPHHITFRRGFVELMELRNRRNWRPAGLAAFLDSPLVALTRLVLSSNDGDDLDSAELVGDLLAHPRLEYLTALQFDEIGVAAAAMAAIVTRPTLPRLHGLGFWSGYYHGEPVRALADSFTLPAVRTLRLSHLGLRDSDVLVVAGSPRLANLTDLNLAGNSFITDAVIEALLASPHLVRLARLTLTGCDHITAAGKAKLRDRFGDGVTLDP